MIDLFPAAARGHTRIDWLDSHHTFSFGDFHDPKRMGFRSLRVINDDRVREGKGFGQHPHRDMEIISYVLEGALAHQDSMGNGSVIKPGDVQRMSAGTGVVHAEHNPSKTDPVHFLQIWLLPKEARMKPGYEQKNFPREDRLGKLRLVVSHDGRDGSITVHQDADLYATILEPGNAVSHALGKGRHAFAHVASGEIDLNGKKLVTGDGATISDESALKITAKSSSEVLLFDLG